MGGKKLRRKTGETRHVKGNKEERDRQREGVGRQEIIMLLAAAVTSSLKLSQLRPTQDLFSYRSGGQKPKSKCWPRLCSFWRLRGKNLSRRLSSSSNACIPWLTAPFLPLSDLSTPSSRLHHSFGLPSTFRPFPAPSSRLPWLTALPSHSQAFLRNRCFLCPSSFGLWPPGLPLGRSLVMRLSPSRSRRIISSSAEIINELAHICKTSFVV